VWQSKNTRKLDAIRDEIDTLNLSDVNKSIALTSLILALDKVDSSLGHFTSYLKEWSARSHNDLLIEVPEYQGNDLDHIVASLDVLSSDFTALEADLAYLDPPYGSNNEKMPPSRVRYASYYHLWTTIINNDKPVLFGAAGRREDTRDAVSVTAFEEFRKSPRNKYIALEAIEKVISSVNSEFVILSYSSGGRVSADELTEILNENGKITSVLSIDYKQNIMARMSWTKDWVNEASGPHQEFLFALQK
jgi:adenine-specific DNA-methyltransferase